MYWAVTSITLEEKFTVWFIVTDPLIVIAGAVSTRRCKSWNRLPRNHRC